MDKVIYSNRIGRRMVVLIVLMDVLIGGLILAMDRGEHIALLLAVIVGLLAVTLLMVWAALAILARNSVAELIRSPTGLTVEIAHILDRGKKLTLPIPSPEDWSWAIFQRGKRSRRRSATPVIRLKSGSRTFSIWPAGARVVNAGELRALAPNVVDEMQASGFLK